MSRKKHKKRVKPVVSSEPIVPTPEPTHNVTRYKAVVRGPLGQWWVDNKKRIRVFAIVAVVAVVLVYLVVELFRLVF